MSVCLCRVWSCGRPWSVCEVVSVPYVGEVVALTVMRVLLFVMHVNMVRECDGARVTVVHAVQVLFLAQLMCYG